MPEDLPCPKCPKCPLTCAHLSSPSWLKQAFNQIRPGCAGRRAHPEGLSFLHATIIRRTCSLLQQPQQHWTLTDALRRVTCCLAAWPGTQYGQTTRVLATAGCRTGPTASTGHRPGPRKQLVSERSSPNAGRKRSADQTASSEPPYFELSVRTTGAVLRSIAGVSMRAPARPRAPSQTPARTPRRRGSRTGRRSCRRA